MKRGNFKVSEVREDHSDLAGSKVKKGTGSADSADDTIAESVHFMGLTLPAEKQDARQLAARLMALTIATIAMMFFAAVLVSNAVEVNDVSAFPRYQMLLILMKSKLVGSTLGILPLIAAAIFSLIHRSDLVDRIFYAAIIVMSLSICILLYIGFIQFNDKNVIDLYYESEIVTVEYKSALKDEMAKRDFAGDPSKFDEANQDVLKFDVKRREYFAERMRGIMLIIVSAYAAMMAALLGLKGFFERIGEMLFK
jgi:hypothetical protein